MTDDKKNIPEAAPPTEAPAPAVENAVALPDVYAPFQRWRYNHCRTLAFRRLPGNPRPYGRPFCL